MAKKLTKTEEYIIDESPEISLGEKTGWTDKIFNVFPALRNKNYQLYFSGQLVSMIGTWLQIVAQGWLVLQLTNSALYIGIVAAAATTPSLLFSLYGGVLSDRMDKRKLLIITQACAMILAFILGILTLFQVINVWEIIVLAFLLGTVTAFDAPARQAYIVEVVGKEDLPSAVSLGSGIFNGARVVGPSVAGILIALFGVGWAFVLNGVSYIAIIIAMWMMQVKPVIHESHLHPLRAIKEGLGYSFFHPIIRQMLLFAAVTSIFGWSYTTIMPVIATKTFGLGASGLGVLYTTAGLGALVSVVIVSAFAKKLDPLYFIIGGNAVFALSLIMFSLTNNLYIALPFLFLSGAGLLSQFSMMNTTVQRLVDDQYRGRVMSIYTLMFMGSAPIGNLQIGYLSQHFGTGFALQVGATVTFLFGIYIFMTRKKVELAFHHYSKNKD